MMALRTANIFSFLTRHRSSGIIQKGRRLQMNEQRCPCSAHGYPLRRGISLAPLANLLKDDNNLFCILSSLVPSCLRDAFFYAMYDAFTPVIHSNCLFSLQFLNLQAPLLCGSHYSYPINRNQGLWGSQYTDMNVVPSSNLSTTPHHNP